MKPLKEKVCITLDADVLEDIKKLSDKRGRPVSQLINLILRKYLASVDKTAAPIDPADDE